jgi:sulfite reductase (ferredoxin)
MAFNTQKPVAEPWATCHDGGPERDPSEELFDVTPYAEALVRHLLRHPMSSSLPRKFKMAFEGCPTDHAYAAINDIGGTARVQDGRRGFRVTVAGGTSIIARSGQELYAFLPEKVTLAGLAGRYRQSPW